MSVSSHFTLFAGECDSAFSEGWLWPAGQSDALGSLAVALSNLDSRLWRSFEGDRQLVVRSFVQPGEPSFSGPFRTHRLRFIPETWVTTSCRTGCRWSARSSVPGRYNRDRNA